MQQFSRSTTISDIFWQWLTYFQNTAGCFRWKPKVLLTLVVRSKRYSKLQSGNDRSFGPIKVANFMTNTCYSWKLNFTAQKMKKYLQWLNAGIVQWKSGCINISPQIIPTNILTFWTVLLRKTTTPGIVALKWVMLKQAKKKTKWQFLEISIQIMSPVTTLEKGNFWQILHSKLDWWNF